MLLQLVEEMLTLIGGLCILYFIYVLLARRSNDKPTAESPAMAHSALRDIIEQVIEEARRLPGFGNSIGAREEATQDGRNIVEHSYEDLLATAILNKVVEQFQRDRANGNNRIINNKTVLSSKPSLCTEETARNYCTNVKSLSQDYNEVSDGHNEKQLEPLTLTLEERIEEITTYTSQENQQDNDVLSVSNTHRVPFPELGMDIIDPFQEPSDSEDESDAETAHVDMVSPIESWEENWLFQKKKISMQANPVAMLVPNPTTEFKALIGDRDAEDTSDLSECSSMQSDEQIEKEIFEVINNVQQSQENGILSNTEDVKNSSNTLIQNVDSDISATVEKQIQSADNIKVDRTTMKDVSDPNEKKEMGDLKRAGGETGESSVCENQRSFKHLVFKQDKLEDMNKNIINKHNTKEVITIDKKDEILKSVVENEHNKKDISKQTESTELNKSLHENNVTLLNDRNDKVVDEKLFNDNIINVSSIEEEENVLNIPKTPACTPTSNLRTDNFPCGNNAEFFTLNNHVVLHSLESAKQKLLTVDENRMNVNKESEPDFRLANSEDAQQESEYTEHYDIATQRHLDSLTKDRSIDNEFESGTSIRPDACNEQTPSDCKQSANKDTCDNSSTQKKTPEEMIQFSTPPRPGSIAEREHKKWENAPPLENNPYSEESIQRRLWERQYSRCSSDIPGIHTDLPKNTGADLEDALSPHEPDIKRFGRDYYINNSKVETNDKGQQSTMSASSRPSSSLSETPSSAGDSRDPKFQERTQNSGTDAVLNSHSNVKLKVALWQKNNIESTCRNGNNLNSIVKISEMKHIGETCVKENGTPVYCQKRLEKHHAEDMENQRKNSKNELNAKLNNQENNYDPGVMLEAKKSDENRKKIQRIDLKAFGFENEISPHLTKPAKISQQRVVNRLNLASYGYDGGLRRAQSNNHLDSTVKDCEFKSKDTEKANKMNLPAYKKFKEMNDHVQLGVLRNDNLTKSTETLNKSYESTSDLYALKTVKSVPNITKYESYINCTNMTDKSTENYNAQNLFDGINELERINTPRVTKPIQNCQLRKFAAIDSESPDNNNLESDTNYFSEEESCQYKNGSIAHTDKPEPRYLTYNKLPLPSVRLLAQVFNKQPNSSPVLAPRPVKPSKMSQERSSTPEVHIVETPKQMHSLTARSLSKKFREGLRQIPNKMTSPPASHVTMEQRYNVLDNQPEIAQTKASDLQDDINVILPGKLKSNIIFWEQLQKGN